MINIHCYSLEKSTQQLSAQQQAKTDDTKRLKSQISNLMVNLSLDHIVIHFSFNHTIKVHTPTTFQQDRNTLPCLTL